MSNIPAEFIMPVSYENTNAPMVLKPVFGTINAQFVTFKVIHRYNETKSKILGYEHLDPIEICEIVNDKFCKAHVMVSDLTPKQKADFAELYERFKQQKDSLDTLVKDWGAIADSERALLLFCHFESVDQLAAAPAEQIVKLGPSGKDLQEKAQRHVKAKGEKIKASEYAEEMQSLRNEISALRAEREAKEEQYFARLEAKVKAVKTGKRGGRGKGGKNKKMCVETEPETTETAEAVEFQE